MPARVLLLIPTTSYKSKDFLDAAERQGVEVVVGTDRRQALEGDAPGHTLTLDFVRPERGLERIAVEHARRPFRAVLGVDDETTVIAAVAAAALGLRHNPEPAVRAARDKFETRRRMAAAGMRAPGFRRVALDDDPQQVAAEVRYPCVLKPLGLSGSRGVLRVDDPRECVRAFRRIAAILGGPDVRRRAGDTEHLLVEDYLPGDEVALEGLLDQGRLRVLALFDKPDPLVGPTFQETIYLTPSALSAEMQRSVEREAATGCRALGLMHGPVHAELRIDGREVHLLEVAARTIGGLCSRALTFGTGISLEELVLRHALGRDVGADRSRQEAAGVMMIPVPRAGVLRSVGGVRDARAVALIEDVTLTVHRGARLVPLPEGDRYVGFVFARGAEPAAVERALREAHSRLSFEVA